MTTAPGAGWQQTLLPANLSDAGGRRSLRDWVVDVAVVLIAAGVSLLALDTTSEGRDELAVLLDLCVGATLWGALWVRRTHPFALGAIAALAAMVAAAAAGPALVATFNAALRCSRRQLAVVAALALCGAAIFPLLYPTESSYVSDLMLGELLTLMVIGWGLVARARREALLSLRDRAERLQAEQQLQIELARTAERQRIAREMHDVLAHRISLLAVHAGALEYRHSDRHEEAAAAAVIHECAHQALQDLRDVIGLLREPEGRPGAPEPPQPTLREIPQLIEQSRAAGMRVRADLEMPAGETSALVARTAYRVIQEGLTNARKHAPATAVEVELTSDDALVVEVVNPRAVGSSTLPGAGAGLIGLAERVTLAHGRLEHGPDASANFVLRATLPL